MLKLVYDISILFKEYNWLAFCDFFWQINTLLPQSATEQFVINFCHNNNYSRLICFDTILLLTERCDCLLLTILTITSTFTATILNIFIIHLTDSTLQQTYNFACKCCQRCITLHCIWRATVYWVRLTTDKWLRAEAATKMHPYRHAKNLHCLSAGVDVLAASAYVRRSVVQNEGLCHCTPPDKLQWYSIMATASPVISSNLQRRRQANQHQTF